MLAADLADAEAVAHVETTTSGLDIGLVVLAAGFGTTGTVLETSLVEEMALIAVNIAAVTRLSHTFAGRLAARGRGGIVLFGSIVGWQGVPGQANYAASKAYVQNLAEGLHDELKPAGVDVLSVAPGPVASGFGTRAGLAMTAADSPEIVATATLKALGRRRTVIPGARGTFLTSALRPLPRRVRSRILGRVIAGMRAPDRRFRLPENKNEGYAGGMTTLSAQVPIAGVPWPLYKLVALAVGLVTLVVIFLVTGSAAPAVLTAAAITTAIWVGFCRAAPVARLVLQRPLQRQQVCGHRSGVLGVVVV